MYRFLHLVLVLFVTKTNAQAILSTKATVFFYVGIENPIAIATPKYSCKEIYIESPNCDVTGSGCSYKITPRQATDSSVLYVRLKSGGHPVVDSLKVQNRYIGPPAVDYWQWGCYIGFRMFKEPRVSFRDYGFEVKSSIVQYEVTISKRDSVIFHSVNIGGAYNEKVKKAIGLIRTGYRLEIRNIVIKGPYSNCWFIPALVHTFT